MKKRKIIALLLLLSTFITLFCGCEKITSIFAPKDVENTTNEDTNNIKDVPPSYTPADCCYEITTDSETYSYGEEINITAKLHIRNPAILDVYEKRLQTDLTVVLEESPYFEIVGDSSVYFENINTSDYLCSEKYKTPQNDLVANFIIKINDPSYTVNEAIITAKFEGTLPNVEIDFYEEKTFRWPAMIYLGDTQGVIVETSRSYIHGGKHKYSIFADESSPLLVSDRNYELIAKSLNREYAAGMSRDEIVNRYYELFLGDDYAVNISSIAKEIGRNQYERSCECYYISTDLRIKVYIPGENANYQFMNSGNGYKATAYRILLFALENNLITTEEFTNEIQRIDRNKDSHSSRIPKYSIEFPGCTFPSDFNVFDQIIDLRKK